MGEHFLVKRQGGNPFGDGTSGKKIVDIVVRSR
jgi:hypothetical protein